MARQASSLAGGEGPCGQRAALHCGGLALNAQTALRCSLLRPHRQTRCVRFALYAQTVAMSMMTNALRAGRKPCAPQRHRGAPRAVPMDLRRQASGTRAHGYPGSDAPNTKGPASRQAGPGGGDLWGAEERRACAQREARSSSCSSPLSERRERSERSEFGDAGARPSTAGQSARSAPDRHSEAPRPAPTRLGSPPADHTAH